MSAPVRVGGTLVVAANRWDLLPEPEEPPEVTAVVLHYRDPGRLALVLAALDAQTHPAARLQVVVTDDGSPEPPVVPPHVTLVRQEDRGFRAAAARNLGASVADGDVLCFLDGDTVPEPGYVAAASALPAVASDVLVVGRRRHADLTGFGPTDVLDWFAGRTPPPTELTEPGWLRDAYAASRDLLDVDARSYRFVISAVLTVHRDLYAAVDGFDETFTAYGGEDWDFAHRAYTAGAVLAHRRDAVAWHDGPDWADRGDDADRRAQKDREAAVLARRIPDRAARGTGSFPTAPRVLVDLVGGSGADHERWTEAATDALPDAVVGEVDRCIMQRTPWRARVDVTAGVDPATLDAVVNQAESDGAGRVVVPGVEVTAARAANRAARHGVALDRLFPVLSGSGSAPNPLRPGVPTPAPRTP
ncbi:glycosyltransferase [Jatrophihabitans sp. YIM 134969]